MRHHPDKGGDAGVFQDINNAYEVLSDPEKRAAYDKYGEAGVGQDGAARREADHIFSRFFGGGRQPQQPTVRLADPHRAAFAIRGRREVPLNEWTVLDLNQ